MGFTSIWHWIIVLLIVLVLFGAGKIPRLMGDFAKGIKAFKSGLKDEEEGDKPEEKKAEIPAVPPAAASTVTPTVSTDASKDKAPNT